MFNVARFYLTFVLVTSYILVINGNDSLEDLSEKEILEGIKNQLGHIESSVNTLVNLTGANGNDTTVFDTSSKDVLHVLFKIKQNKNIINLLKKISGKYDVMDDVLEEPSIQEEINSAENIMVENAMALSEFCADTESDAANEYCARLYAILNDIEYTVDYLSSKKDYSNIILSNLTDSASSLDDIVEEGRQNPNLLASINPDELSTYDDNIDESIEGISRDIDDRIQSIEDNNTNFIIYVSVISSVCGIIAIVLLSVFIRTVVKSRGTSKALDTSSNKQHFKEAKKSSQYQRRNSVIRGYNKTDDNSGGFDETRDTREWFDETRDNRGGYDERSSNRGGFDETRGNRGGFNPYNESYNKRGYDVENGEGRQGRENRAYELTELKSDRALGSYKIFA